MIFNISESLKKGGLLFLYLCFILGCICTHRLIAGESKTAISLYESDLGSYEMDAINTGYLVVMGRYIMPPYKVERKGRGVFINEHCVYLDDDWPMPDLTVEKEPHLPSGITDNSSWDDLVLKDSKFNSICDEMQAYLIQKNDSRKDYVLRFMSFLKSIPFVEEVKPCRIPGTDPSNPETYYVIEALCKDSNKNRGFDLNARYNDFKNPATYMIKGKGKVFVQVHSQMMRYADLLERGCVIIATPYYYSRSYDLSMEGQKVLLGLSIIKNDQSARRKLFDLQRIGFFININDSEFYEKHAEPIITSNKHRKTSLLFFVKAYSPCLLRFAPRFKNRGHPEMLSLPQQKLILIMQH